MEILLAVGLGIGLASVAGIRAFPPLAFVYYLTLLEGPFLPVEVPYGVVIATLVALAVLEIVLDKLRTVERTFNYVMVPVRISSGAVLFGSMSSASTISGAVPWLVAGGLVAGSVAVLKVLFRPPAQAPSSGVAHTTLSVFEDIIGVVGGVLALFVPLLPMLLVAFLLFFFSRIRKRRGRKFGGLRILGD